MKETREKLYLAALLHDIGKFYQRADTGSVNSSKELKEYNKEEGSFCPQYKGNYTHKHVLWTAQFIDTYQPLFKKLLSEEPDNKTANKDSLINLAAGHHLAFEQISVLGQLIKKADWLSSGMDRESQEAMNEAEAENNQAWDAFKKIRMRSILESIHKKELQHKFQIPVDVLSLSDSLFPRETFDKSPDYKGLWQSFVMEFEMIQAGDCRVFSETLLFLLNKYTSCIPSSTVHLPDISLFDHAKTTAALAVCLYDFKKANEKLDSDPFILLGGDLSGIQSYIYQIISKHAGKNLKGRSFYLKLLSDSIVRYILKELSLFQANVIYNAGGSFYIIAPNTQIVREKIKEICLYIEKKLWNNHGTDLFMAIDYVTLSEDVLLKKQTTFADKWGELFKKTDNKKTRRYESLIESEPELFFEPHNTGADVKIDSITGEELSTNENIIIDGDLFLKKTTADQIELGKVLRETDYLIVSEEKITYLKNSFCIQPCNIGVYYYFKNRDIQELTSQSIDNAIVITLNGKEGACDFLNKVKGNNVIYSFDFYGGNEAPRNSYGNPLSYEDLCKSDGLERMGVLRMDVDNLGTIFQQGISPGKVSLSRFSALSRSLDYFFSGYLNIIWKEIAPQTSFIIYSGGDDLFIIGKWTDTIRLAEKVKDAFYEYTCHNTNFSISGGISIVQPDFPIMRAAEESAHEESKAKKHKLPAEINKADLCKNSLSFMGMPMNWTHEYPTIKSLKNDILSMLKDDDLRKSFISKILNHWNLAEVKNHKVKNVKLYWMLSYDLGRMKKRMKDNDIAIALIDDCISDICNMSSSSIRQKNIKTIYHPIEIWALAARWAELEKRTL